VAGPALLGVALLDLVGPEVLDAVIRRFRWFCYYAPVRVACTKIDVDKRNGGDRAAAWSYGLRGTSASTNPSPWPSSYAVPQ